MKKESFNRLFLIYLKNAIEAMPNGGQLEIYMNSNKNVYEISIKDTGVGMNFEQIGRLGKPYFTTKGQKGTGLGMMVAYRVIEELNGKIKVTSQIGKGTTFTIYLPHSLPRLKPMGFFLTNIPLTTFHQKRQRRDLGEQLLREGHSFKRARSVPTTPLYWRYFFPFSVDRWDVSFVVFVPRTKNVYTTPVVYRPPNKEVEYPSYIFYEQYFELHLHPDGFLFYEQNT